MRDHSVIYNSDSEHYNDNYDFDSDNSVDRYSSDLYSYKCNHLDSQDVVNKNSGIKRPVKSVKKKRKLKRTIPVKIHENVIKKYFMKNDLYCLKCGTRTKSHGTILLRDNYENTHRYRLTRLCKVCNSKGCKFLKTNTVDDLIANV